MVAGRIGSSDRCQPPWAPKPAGLVFFLLVLCLPTTLFAANEDARIVLHAHPYVSPNTCSTPQIELGLDCDLVRPITSVTPGQEILVYIYLHSYDSAAGVQMAFSWDPSWTFIEWRGPCQSHELTATGTPSQSGDSYIAAFDVLTGGQLTPLARIHFTAGSAGTELIIEETWAPGGTGMADASNVFTSIPNNHRGVIAVGSPGVDSCGGKSQSDALFEE